MVVIKGLSLFFGGNFGVCWEVPLTNENSSNEVSEKKRQLRVIIMNFQDL